MRHAVYPDGFLPAEFDIAAPLCFRNSSISTFIQALVKDSINGRRAGTHCLPFATPNWVPSVFFPGFATNNRILDFYTKS